MFEAFFFNFAFMLQQKYIINLNKEIIKINNKILHNNRLEHVRRTSNIHQQPRVHIFFPQHNSHTYLLTLLTKRNCIKLLTEIQCCRWLKAFQFLKHFNNPRKSEWMAFNCFVYLSKIGNNNDPKIVCFLGFQKRWQIPWTIFIPFHFFYIPTADIILTFFFWLFISPWKIVVMACMWLCSFFYSDMRFFTFQFTKISTKKHRKFLQCFFST